MLRTIRALAFKGVWVVDCRNLIKKPWPQNPNVLGFILRTLIKEQGFLIRFLYSEY